jgi:mxaD protein
MQVSGALAVVEKIDLAAPPSATWMLVRDFMGWQHWHPEVVSTALLHGHGNTAGSVRMLTAEDGAMFTDELVAHHPMSRTLRWRVIESPLPVTDCVCALEVIWRKGGSSVLWGSAFRVKAASTQESAVRVVSAFCRAGLDNLSRTFK